MLCEYLGKVLWLCMLMVLCISFFINGNEVVVLMSGVNGVVIELNKLVWLSIKLCINLGLSGFLLYLLCVMVIILLILMFEG